MSYEGLDRAQVMALRYARGEPLASIGRDFGVSGEAVRQALMRSGYVTAGAAARARRRRAEVERQSAEAVRARRRQSLMAWLERVPQTMTREQAAEKVGIDPRELVRLVGDSEARRLLIWSSGARPRVFSDEQVVAALRAVAAELGVRRLPHKLYGRVRGEDRPSVAIVVRRFGTWGAACEAAGLETGTRPKTYRNRRSDEELLGYVARFLSTAENPTATSYDVAARLHRWPSLTLLRQRFGSWSLAKIAAAQVADATSAEAS